MSNIIDDGGPAFALDEVPNVRPSYPGMTLLDYFAGQALHGILSNAEYVASAARVGVATNEFRSDTVHTAYVLGSLMVAEKRRLEALK